MVFCLRAGRGIFMGIFFLASLVLSIFLPRFDEKIESEEFDEDDFSVIERDVECDNSTHCIGCLYHLTAGYICGVQHEHCNSCPQDSLAT